MIFTQHKTENGKLLVYLDPEDTELMYPEKYKDADGKEIDLDTPERKKKYFETVYKPLLLFNAETYDTLKRFDTSSWNVVFGSVNKFISMLSQEDRRNICMVFIVMHSKLNEMISINMVSIIDELAAMLDTLDQQIDLCSKLEHFVELDMPIPNLDDVGGRPQDTEEMTFRRPHILMLTGIALLCKLLAPIFGQFFWQYKKNTSVDNNIKEIHAASILKDIFGRRYRKLILKLNHFVGNILIQQYKQKDDIISAYNGNTMDSQALNGVAAVFTRKFITVDLYKTDGNLMTYITTCLKNSVDTQYRTASTKNSIKERDGNLKETASDEGNASRLENESFTSSKTADVPIIVEWIIELTVNKWMIETGMSQEMYDTAMAYYKNNLPPMTPISNYLLCTYFGADIGGAIGVSMLSAMAYAKLAIILQYVLIKEGFHGLAHALMIVPKNRMKAVLSNIDNKVQMTWSNTYSYRNFKQRFPFGVGDKECDAKLKEIVDFLTFKIHSFNTAPVFWDMMNEDNKNGVEYQCTPDIMERLCDFINGVTLRERDNVA